jgi:hypothetical protein
MVNPAQFQPLLLLRIAATSRNARTFSGSLQFAKLRNRKKELALSTANWRFQLRLGPQRVYKQTALSLCLKARRTIAHV